MSFISFQVNGNLHQVSLPPNTPLVTILRQELGLKGTRFGCGEERCGCCTVLIDGKPQHSCKTELWAVEGRHITTIEGLVKTGRVDDVPRMFVDEQAAQCGYCTNGIIVSVVGLLEKQTAPTREEVLDFLDERHLCRCGSHPRIIRIVDRLLSERESS